VDGYSGDASDALAGPVGQYAIEVSNGMMFTTADSDNDDYTGNCAVDRGGWWYRRCSVSFINKDATTVWVADSWNADVQASCMLVKLN